MPADPQFPNLPFTSLLPPGEEAPPLLPKLLLVECDSFHVTHRAGRMILELRGATATPDLPFHRSYLTPEQVAERLQTSTRTVRKMMAHKENPIPFVRIGGKPRFIEEEVSGWAGRGGSITARRTRQIFKGRPDIPCLLTLKRGPRKARMKKKPARHATPA